MLNRRSFCSWRADAPRFHDSFDGVGGSGAHGEFTFHRASSLEQTPQDSLCVERCARHPFYWWPRTLLSYPIEFQVRLIWIACN